MLNIDCEHLFRFELIEIMRASGMKTDGATGPSGGENRFQRISVDILMVFWLYTDILLVGNFAWALGFNNLKSAPNLTMVVRSRGEGQFYFRKQQNKENL